MNELFGIVTAQQCYLRSRPGRSESENESQITDEIFSGWAVRIFTKGEEELSRVKLNEARFPQMRTKRTETVESEFNEAGICDLSSNKVCRQKNANA